MLQAADIGVGGRQLNGVAGFQRLRDGRFRLLDGARHRVAIINQDGIRRDLEQAGQNALHLARRVAFEDIDRQPFGFGLAQGGRLFAVVVFERQHHIGIAEVFAQGHVQVQAADGLLQARAAHPERVDAERLGGAAGRTGRTGGTRRGGRSRHFVGLFRVSIHRIVSINCEAGGGRAAFQPGGIGCERGSAIRPCLPHGAGAETSHTAGLRALAVS